MMTKIDPKQRKSLEEIREIIQKLDLTEKDINDDEINENYKISDFKKDDENMEEDECSTEEEEEIMEESESSNFRGEIEVDAPTSEEIQKKIQEVQNFIQLLLEQHSYLSSAKKPNEYALTQIDEQIRRSQQELMKIDENHFFFV